MQTKILVIAGLILLLAAGCVQQSSQGSNTPEQVEVDRDLANQVKQEAKAIGGVDESTAVVVDDEVYVGIKVSGLDRFRLRTIRQEVHNTTREMVPQDYFVNVTSDKRLFVELQEVESQINQTQGNPPGQIKNRLEQINKDMQG